MKKVYISCYENSDYKYKEILIKSNEIRGNKLFTLVQSDSDFVEKDYLSKKDNIIPFIKKNVLRGADVVVFLIGEETYKRRVVDWEARAAMSSFGVLDKCGIVIVYLPELIEKYGSKIPRIVLPEILKVNVESNDVFVLETTWEKIKRDINILDKLLKTSYAYSRMSNYVLTTAMEKENICNYPENSFK
ncbi:MAG: TIR domain-containing protein [Malacoplasma sp.]|nr:TIR domain-containing protein [Malacoplasma sp.]